MHHKLLLALTNNAIQLIRIDLHGFGVDAI